MSGIGVFFLIVFCCIIFLAPRRVAASMLFVSVSLFHIWAKNNIGIVELSALRITIAAGLLRIIVKREKMAGGVQFVDMLVFLFVVVEIIMGMLQGPVMGGLANRAGKMLGSAAAYFYFRYLIQDMEDLRFVLVFFTVLLIPLSIMLLIEKVTSKNMFSLFCAFPLEVTIRDGKVRAAGPFEHAILAGSYFSTMLPLVITHWWGDRKHKVLCIAGVLATLVAVYASTSSGPILAIGFSILGMFVYRIRNRMNVIRWLIIIGIICLHIVMKAPVWYILAKIDLTGSSTGWHRAELFDSTLRHINEWWLIGTTYTRHWMPTGIPASENHTDLTNQYIAYAVDGGLLLLIIFIYIQMRCFKNVGLILRQNGNSSIEENILPWALGVVVFSEVCTFFSISFFDQSTVSVFFVFAMITFLSSNQKDINMQLESNLIDN